MRSKGCFVTVFARRWDGIGCRLCAIVNALRLARSINAEFRFVWPRPRGFEELHDIEQFFSPSFARQFEATDAILASTVIDENTRLRTPEHYREIISAGGAIAVELPFQAFRFEGESEGEAQQQFLDAFGAIDWSPEIGRLVAAICNQASWPQYHAVHIRAGDIVTGDWRQYVPVEKYAPTWAVETVIQRWSAAGERILVVSDNPEYLAHLFAKHPMLRSAADFIPGHDMITAGQRDLADLLLLAGAQGIMCPRYSGFSRTAALIARSPPEITTPASAFTPREMLEAANYSLADQARVPDAEFKSRPALISRDACWTLDVAGDSMAPKARVKLASFANDQDPAYCGAGARQVFHGIGLLPGREMRKAVQRASASAASTRWRHDDPFVEAEAAKLTLGIAEVLETASWLVQHWPRSLAFIANPYLRWKMARIGKALSRFSKLRPFQTPLPAVSKSLRFQYQIARRTIGKGWQADPVRRNFLVGMRTPMENLETWRPSGHLVLQRDGAFPATLRNVDLMSIRMADALSKADFPVGQVQPVSAAIDSIEWSPSGLAWVSLSAATRQDTHGFEVIESGGLSPIACVSVAGGRSSEKLVRIRMPVTCETAKMIVDRRDGDRQTP